MPMPVLLGLIGLALLVYGLFIAVLGEFIGVFSPSDWHPSGCAVSLVGLALLAVAVGLVVF